MLIQGVKGHNDNLNFLILGRPVTVEQHGWVYFYQVHSVLLLVEQMAQKQLYKNRWVAVVALQNREMYWHFRKQIHRL